LGQGFAIKKNLEWCQETRAGKLVFCAPRKVEEENKRKDGKTRPGGLGERDNQGNH